MNNNLDIRKYNKKIINHIICIKTVLSVFILLIYIFTRLYIYKINNFIYKNIKPKIIAISYSNEKYQRQLKLNKKSALEVGKVDIHYSYGPNDIDPNFKKKNKDILSRTRGNGYWLWKPYFINRKIE